jgi:hypothetical protein
MSETMNLHQVPETMSLHRALWAGRIMSAVVVIALVADGIIQLFAPAQIASMLQETGFAMDLTRVVGPIVLACAILYAIPATAVLGAILVTGFLGGAICAHVRIGELGSPPEIISLLLGAMTWGGLYARSPYPGHSAAHPLNQQGQCSVPQDQEKTHVFSNGNHGKSGRRNGRTSVGARQGSTRASPQSREGVKLGEPGRGIG